MPSWLVATCGLSFFLIIWGTGSLFDRYMEKRYFGNPEDVLLKVRKKSRYISPKCDCPNCLGKGDTLYYWSIEGSYTAGMGDRRKNRKAYLSGHQRYKSWKAAMIDAEEHSKNLSTHFWRGYY